MTTETPPPPALPSEPAEIAAMMQAADDTGLKELWDRMVEELGYNDGLKLWEAAHREILAARRDRAVGEASGRPGDKSFDGLAAALRRFVRAAGLGGESRFLRGEVRAGSSALDADLFLHLWELDRTAEVGRAFGFEHATIDRTIDGDRTIHHHYRGEWEGYRVDLVCVDTNPPAPEEVPGS